MYARKCPKCGDKIQTKVIKKAIGLGFIDIPVAQFCLNPACDWYQDFTRIEEPDEIKEDVLQIKVPHIAKELWVFKKPVLSKRHVLLIIGLCIVIIAILFINSMIQFDPDK